MHIQLHKRIPLGAGLGGGSSNAGMTLLALDHLWETQLPREQLMDYAKRLGADVPIFVHGHNAFAEGIGEQLTTLDLPKRWFVLAFPAVHINTKTLFAHPDLTRNSKPITIREYQAGVETSNVFTPVVCQLYPEVAKAIEILKPYGDVRITGTGSTVFLPVETFAQAQDIIGQISKQLVTCVAHSLSEALLDGLQTSPQGLSAIR